MKNFLFGTVTFIFSFFVTSFLVFLFFERFPDATSRVFPDEVRYYAVHRAYVKDPALVFRKRAGGYRVEAYKGDLYRKCLRVSYNPFPFERWIGANGLRRENPARSDIVLLGDSYLVMAESIPDSLSHRVQMISGLPTADLGTEWHGPCQYLEAFKRYGLPRKPRFAVVCFFEGNDLEDVAQYQRWKNGGDYYHFNLSSKSLFSRYFIASGDVWRYFKRRTRALLRIPAEYNLDCSSELVEVRLGDRMITTVFSYKSDTQQVERILDSPEAAALSKVFVEWKRLCHENNIRPLVVFIPTAAHVYGPHSTERSGASWLKMRAQQLGSRNHLETAIERIVRQASLPFMSLTPAFEQAAREGQFLYYTFDTHWNSEARLIASQRIAEQLELLI